MRTTKLITVSMVPELLKKVDQVAEEENRTRSELLREAIRRYIEEKEWQRFSRYARVKALERGIREEDIEGLIEEYRSEQANA